MPEIYKIIEISLVAAFIILVATKVGVRYRLRDICDIHNLRPIASMLNCDLCISFWTAVVCSIILACYTRDAQNLLIPVFSTPITRVLI